MIYVFHYRVFRKLQGQVHSISLKGVDDAYSKHTDDKSDPKGIKAHFRMDENGILSLEQVRLHFVEDEDIVQSLYNAMFWVHKECTVL